MISMSQRRSLDTKHLRVSRQVIDPSSKATALDTNGTILFWALKITTVAARGEMAPRRARCGWAGHAGDLGPPSGSRAVGYTVETTGLWMKSPKTQIPDWEFAQVAHCIPKLG